MHILEYLQIRYLFKTFLVVKGFKLAHILSWILALLTELSLKLDKEGLIVTALWLMREAIVTHSESASIHRDIYEKKLRRYKKKLAKAKNKQQGADNYETFLNETFIYPSKGVAKHEGVKPYFSSSQNQLYVNYHQG